MPLGHWQAGPSPASKAAVRVPVKATQQGETAHGSSVYGGPETP